MKVKKDNSKNKKKKSKIHQVANTGIKKSKKSKVKIENDSEVGETIKKDLIELAESQSTSKKSPLRVERWNSYLKAFLLHEKLNKKQKLIMEFCTNKSLTTPRRKAKFLRFVRNCYCNQADVSDELVNELFDTILQKYSDYKLGKYHNSDPNDTVKTSPKIGANKKKKSKHLAEAKANSSPTKSPSKLKTEKEDEEKWTKVKSKKRKPRTPVKAANNTDMETDN